MDLPFTTKQFLEVFGLLAVTACTVSSGDDFLKIYERTCSMVSRSR